MATCGTVRRLLAALVVSLSSGLGSVPSGHAIAAGAQRADGHGSAARTGISRRTLPAGLAAVLQRVLGDHVLAARESWRGQGVPSPDATWSQQAEITASDGMQQDLFGQSLALSGDTAVIGAPIRNHNTGAAYVFVRSGGIWTQQAELTASDGAANDEFGWSVAMRGDTALIGALFKTVGGTLNSGAAYVFIRKGTTWTQRQELAASDGTASAYFGAAVAMTQDTALIAAPYKTVRGNVYAGAVYAFVRSGATWTQQAELTARDGTSYDSFGDSVAIYENTALVGARQWNGRPGAAYVFVRSGSLWTEQAKLTPGDGAPDDNFGIAVSLGKDTALVGADSKNTLTGAAYVFVRSGATWTQQADLTARDGATDGFFGHSVAVQGATAVIGAYGEHNLAGAAYVFVRSGTSWRQQAELLPRDIGNDFGISVDLNRNTALVGEPLKNNSTGAVYVFVRH